MDWIFTNANVITMDRTRPRAKNVIVRDGKFLAIGEQRISSDSDKRKIRIVDCHGMTILPGFIDPHIHLFALAKRLFAVDLGPQGNVRAIRDLQDKIRDWARQRPAGAWIRGRGYHEFYLAEKRHPTCQELDEATSFHPLILTHRSGRAHVLNSLALAQLGINAETADPPGGIIDRDLKTGKPTGVLYGMAGILARKLPSPDIGQLEEGMRLASRELCSMGITSLHDVSPHNDTARWEMFRNWKKRGCIVPKVTMSLCWKGFEAYLKHPDRFSPDDAQFRLGGVKILLHETTGRLSPAPEVLRERVLRVHQAGLQVLLHAIEESTIEAACDAIAYAVRQYPRPDHRHRIEHCSVCRPSLARRIASLGIVVVTQPPFIHYNGDRYLQTVAKPKQPFLYPFKTLMECGVTVAGSSDSPFVPANPLTGIYAAAVRKTEQGKNLLPEEVLLPEDALRMYTEKAAKAGFEENIKGSITLGKPADMVVLSDDPTRVPIEEIKQLTVEMTLIDGRVVWERESQ